MEKSELKEKRKRIKTLLTFYAPCLVVLAILCAMIYFTSNYYATSYPYSNVSALPHNLTTVLLSMFNGYTEKVPFNENRSAVIQGINSTRQDADQSVNGTIQELALAFVTVMLFSVFGLLLGKPSRHRRTENNRRYFLPAIFLLALIVSQYTLG